MAPLVLFRKKILKINTCIGYFIKLKIKKMNFISYNLEKKKKKEILFVALSHLILVHFNHFNFVYTYINWVQVEGCF